MKVLSYIEEITKSIYSDAASVSLIIPFIRGLCLTLEKMLILIEEYVRTMKANMLKSLNNRYDGVEQEDVLAVATLLDPHFKDKYFSNAEHRLQPVNSSLNRCQSCQMVMSQRYVPSPKRKKRNDSKILNFFSEYYKNQEQVLRRYRS